MWLNFIPLVLISVIVNPVLAGVLPNIPLLPSIWALSSSEQRDIVNNINLMRGLQEDTPSVSWSSKAASSAQDKVADYNCNGGTSLSNDDYGYTVYVGKGGVAGAVASWYNGVNFYDFNNPQINSDDRDFIQLVWVQSTSVGCAKRSCGSNTVYLCQYYLPGVYRDILTYNVKELRAKTSTDTKTETATATMTETQNILDTSTATETILTVETQTITAVTVSTNEQTKNLTSTNTVTYTHVTTDIHTKNVTSVNTETFTEITTDTMTMNHTSTETIVESKEVTVVLTNNVTSVITLNMTDIHTSTYTVVSKETHTLNLTSLHITTYTELVTDTLTLNWTSVETVISPTTETSYIPTEITKTVISNITTVLTEIVLTPHTVINTITNNHTQTEVVSMLSNITLTDTVTETIEVPTTLTETYTYIISDNITHTQSSIIHTTATQMITINDTQLVTLFSTVTQTGTKTVVVTTSLKESIYVTHNATVTFTSTEISMYPSLKNSSSTVPETSYVTLLSNEKATETTTLTIQSVETIIETVSNVLIQTTTISDDQTITVPVTTTMYSAGPPVTVTVDRFVNNTVIIENTIVSTVFVTETETVHDGKLSSLSLNSTQGPLPTDSSVSSGISHEDNAQFASTSSQTKPSLAVSYLTTGNGTLDSTTASLDAEITSTVTSVNSITGTLVSLLSSAYPNTANQSVTEGKYTSEHGNSMSSIKSSAYESGGPPETMSTTKNFVTSNSISDVSELSSTNNNILLTQDSTSLEYPLTSTTMASYSTSAITPPGNIVSSILSDLESSTSSGIESTNSYSSFELSQIHSTTSPDNTAINANSRFATITSSATGNPMSTTAEVTPSMTHPEISMALSESSISSTTSWNTDTSSTTLGSLEFEPSSSADPQKTDITGSDGITVASIETGTISIGYVSSSSNLAEDQNTTSSTSVEAANDLGKRISKDAAFMGEQHFATSSDFHYTSTNGDFPNQWPTGFNPTATAANGVGGIVPAKRPSTYSEPSQPLSIHSASSGQPLSGTPSRADVSSDVPSMTPVTEPINPLGTGSVPSSTPVVQGVPSNAGSKSIPATWKGFVPLALFVVHIV